MKILVNDKQKLLGAPAISRTESKAITSFARFDDIVKAVDISVQDVNGPRGGIDKECRVLVKLKKVNFACSVFQVDGMPACAMIRRSGWLIDTIQVENVSALNLARQST
ncbi:MAG: hypothetical protein AB8B55_24755 [Mariniblastus sp.]